MENGKRGFIEFGKGRNSLSPCHSSSVLGDLQMGHLIPKRQVLLMRLTNEKKLRFSVAHFTASTWQCLSFMAGLFQRGASVQFLLVQ